MATFGLSSTGFLIKRLTQILSDMDAKARVEFGEGVNTGNTGALGKYLGITAAELSELWELAESVWGAMSPSTAEGILLDSLIELNNIVRLPADETEFWARYDGVNGTIVPADSVSRHPDTEDLYDLIAATTIAATTALQAFVEVTLNGAGAWAMTVDGHAYSVAGAGTAQLTADAIRTEINTTESWAITAVSQASRQFTIAGNHITAFVATKGVIVTAGANAGNYTVVSSTFDGANTLVVVTEDIDSAAVAGNLRQGITAFVVGDDATVPAATVRIDVAFPDAATNADNYDVSIILGVPGAGTWAFNGVGTAGLTRARETGPKIVAQGVVFSSVTGTGGLTGIVAALAGDTGRDVETDSEVRVRRLNSLQQGGTTVDAIRAALLVVDGVDAVRVYENDTFATVGLLPPKCVNAVVRGGDAQAIGDEIWAQKAAGIQAFGSDQTVTVVDLQGVSHAVQFDRVTDVRMLVTVQVRSLDTEESLPTDAAGLIQSTVETTGNELNIGGNVIARRFYGPIYDAVSGLEVIDVVVRRFVTVPPATVYDLDETIVASHSVILAAASGDATLIFTGGVRFSIESSVGDDGAYTVVSSSFGAGRTTIIVESDQGPATTTGPALVGNVMLATEAEAIDDNEEATFDANDVTAVGV